MRRMARAEFLAKRRTRRKVRGGAEGIRQKRRRSKSVGSWAHVGRAGFGRIATGSNQARESLTYDKSRLMIVMVVPAAAIVVTMTVPVIITTIGIFAGTIARAVIIISRTVAVGAVLVVFDARRGPIVGMGNGRGRVMSVPVTLIVGIV